MQRSGVIGMIVGGVAMSLVGLVGCDGSAAVDNRKIPAAVKALEDKVTRARAGQAVDFDGDGFAEYRQWTDANGVLHAEVRTQEDKIRSHFETRPDGSFKRTFSEHADEHIDTQEERVDGKLTRLYATNKSGTADKRVILMESDKADAFRVVEEEMTAGGWVARRDGDVPSRIEWLPNNADALSVRPFAQPPSKQGLSQVAFTTEDGTLELKFGFKVLGHPAGDNGLCTPGEVDKVLVAIAGIAEQSLDCLAVTHPEMADVISNALAGNYHLNIYCGLENEPELMSLPPEQRILAFARPANLRDGRWEWVCDATSPCTLQFNRDFLNQIGPHLSPNEFQHALLHEFLHALGFELEEAKSRKDKVSSCARYCSGCAAYGEGHFADAGADCARCSSTEGKKATCGYKVTYPFSTPELPEGQSPICGLDMSGMPVVCSQSRVEQALFCDDSIAFSELFDAETMWCCETCPVNNRRPCEDAQGQPLPLPPDTLLNFCDQPPPFCR